MATPALGGRFDQTMHSINLLYMLKDERERRCILVSDENLTVLLDKVKKKRERERESGHLTTSFKRVNMKLNANLIWKVKKSISNMIGHSLYLILVIIRSNLWFDTIW